MASKSRSPRERERDLAETAALYLRGWTQSEIAQRLHVSRPQIGYDLKVLQQRWQESALADFNTKKATELARVDQLERTYWEAWDLHEALRQSRNLAGRVQSYNEKQVAEADRDDVYFRLPAKTRDSKLQLHLDNGSRIIGLPASEGKVRVYSSVALLLIDEASRVSDALYSAMRPMLAVSRGRLLALSTPCGKRGWFHEAWSGPGDWQRVKITAEQCPRIAPDFLAEERRELGERCYRQEYLCSFEDAVGAVFAYDDIRAAFDNDLEPMFPKGLP
jgi:hypothetical protein